MRPPTQTKYDGYLTVQLLPVQRPMEKEPEGLFSKHYYEVEGIQNMKNFSTFRKTKHFEDTIEENKIKMKEKDLRKLRRKRGKDKNCEIPNKFIAKFNSGEMGCLRLEFSPDGRYLAAACTLAGYRTVIRIFEVEDEPFKEVFKYRGHKNIIHELSWIQFKQKDQYLLSCSSDFTARVWLVPFQTNNYIGEEESETEYLLTTMNHPSYVYSGKFHPRSYETSSFIIVTACFDSKVRIWGVNPQARGQILNSNPFSAARPVTQPRHPALQFSCLPQLAERGTSLLTLLAGMCGLSETDFFNSSTCGWGACGCELQILWHSC